jgi:hypothetical protein
MNLDGIWEVRRTGGWLPPMVGVRKRIRGSRGETRLGSLPGLPFDVDGASLRYRKPFSAFVDVVEPDGELFRGRATFRGREFARFELHRVEEVRVEEVRQRSSGPPE